MSKAAVDIGAITSKGRLNNCQLHFSVASRGNRTYLNKSFCTPPFRIVDITEDKKSALAYLMTMSSSPGILDHDFHDIKITAEPHTSTVLQNQSYQRIFQSNSGGKLSMEIDLQEGSTFSYIQHPLVPHQQSIFKAVNKIFLSHSTELLFGEIITCGRKLSGEVFKFNRFHSVTEVFFNRSLALKDNILIEPKALDLAGIGQLEGYTHQATLYYINRRDNQIDHAYAYTKSVLEETEDIEFGHSKTLPNAMVVRVLANGGEKLLQAFRKIEAEVIINKINAQA